MIGRRGLVLGLTLGLPVLTAGCGFRPVYGVAQAGRGELPAVYVSLIPNRSGQLLRQALQARLEGGDGGATKRFVLTVAYSEAEQIVGTQSNNFATRARSVGNATWILRPVDNPSAVLKVGSVRTVDGYNLIDEQFFYQDLQEDAVQRRLAQAVAEQVALGLSLYFDAAHPPGHG